MTPGNANLASYDFLIDYLRIYKINVFDVFEAGFQEFFPVLLLHENIQFKKYTGVDLKKSTDCLEFLDEDDPYFHDPSHPKSVYELYSAYQRRRKLDILSLNDFNRIFRLHFTTDVVKYIQEIGQNEDFSLLIFNRFFHLIGSMEENMILQWASKACRPGGILHCTILLNMLHTNLPIRVHNEAMFLAKMKEHGFKLLQSERSGINFQQLIFKRN